MFMTRRRRSLLFAFALWAAICPSSTHAQSTEINLKATSANVKESGSPVKVRIIRWSTDEERNPIVAALNPAPPAAAPARAAGGGAAAAGRGGAAAARGRGAAGRGGRGDAAPITPIAALTAAINKAPTIGYIWTTDITGYSIKYAFHAPLPDGGERIILATDRRLGAYSPGWKIAAATPSDADYQFTLIEIRLDAKGSGEGKASLMTKVVVDNEAKTIALDNYASTPAILQNVKR